MERTFGGLMWLELPNLWIALINVIGIPVTHLTVAWISTQLPANLFEYSPSHRHDSHDRNGKPSSPNPVYEKIFFIRRWKKFLPDAAPWFKGFSKKSLQSGDPEYIRTFITETRRGESSHWIQWFLISGFIIWNPYPANIIILIYAMIANLPCILNLRYTRERMLRYLDKQSIHSLQSR